MIRLYLSFDESICILFYFVAYQYILHTGCTVQIHSSIEGAFDHAFDPGNTTFFVQYSGQNLVFEYYYMDLLNI